MLEIETRGSEPVGITMTWTVNASPDDRFPDVVKWYVDLVEQEIKYRVEVGVGIGCKELRVHVEDAPEGGAGKAEGGEAFLDGVEGGNGARPEVRVFTEGLLGIDVEAGEVEELLPEQEAGVRERRRRRPRRSRGEGLGLLGRELEGGAGDEERLWVAVQSHYRHGTPPFVVLLLPLQLHRDWLLGSHPQFSVALTDVGL